jgi:hypothetical protein
VGSPTRFHLAEVETVINRLHLTKTTAERQELALSTMRSLVADGGARGWFSSATNVTAFSHAGFEI